MLKPRALEFINYNTCFSLIVRDFKK